MANIYSLKSRWLFMLLAFVVSGALSAQTLTEGFETVQLTDSNGDPVSGWSYGTGMDNGWKVVGGSIGSSAGSTNYGLWSTAHTGSKSLEASYGSTNAASVVITEKLVGTFTFWARKTSTSSSTKGTITLYEATENGDSYTVSSTSLYTNSSLTTTWTQYTVDLGDEGKYVAINLVRAAIDDIEGTIFQQAEGPAFAAYDGKTKLTDTYSYNFGLTTPGTEKVFTLKNPGTESVTVNIAATGGFGIDKTSATIEAKGETTLTVTMADATATGTITLAPAEAGVEGVTFAVSGTVRDANKMFIDFADGQMPDEWSNVMIGSYGSGWEINSGYASHSNSAAYDYYLAALTSPLLKFTEGENLFFDVARYGSSTYSTAMVKVQTSADGETWKDLYTTPDAQLVYGTWNTQNVTMPAGNYYIRFYGGYAHITNIYGGELPTVANMKVTAEDHDFGMITADQTTTFTIENKGKAELTDISVTSDNEAFTISNAPATLAAGASAEVTVTAKATAVGVQSATITVTAPDQTTATFVVSSCVMPADAFVIDFNDNELPAGWGNNASNKWSFGDGKAYATSAAELTSPELEFTDGAFFAISATSYDNYDNNYLEITGSTDGANWNAFTTKRYVSRSQIPFGSYATLVVTDIPTNVKYIKLKGYYVRIDEIVGLVYNQNAPALEVTPADAAAFGRVKAQPEAKTYTVKNAGTGTLTGTITSDNAAFTVSESEFSLAQGETLSFDVNLVFDDNYGEKAATITVHPTNEGLSDVTIAATATTADPSIWEEDFEDGIPATWTNDGWTATTSNYGNNGTYMAYAGTSAGTTLTTPRLYATEGQTLSFEVGSGTDATDQLTVEYSNDRAAWTAIDGSPITAAGTYTFTAPADGYYFLRFAGRYAGLDNFYGFKEAPAEHDAIVSAVSIPATGNQYLEYTASVTVSEKAGKAEELTAKFFIGETQYGEAVTETVEANGTKTFTVSFTPDVAAEGEAYFTLANDDLSLESAKTSVRIAAALVLDETVAPELTDGTAASVVFTYTAKAGWNTITFPFNATADDFTAIFGEGYKAFEFSGYKDGALEFKASTYFAAGYPYVVYAEAPANEKLYKQNVSIVATPKNDQHTETATGNTATFYGTYAPKAAGEMDGLYGVTNDAKIAKGSAQATMKGFRGYFELPDGASVRIKFPDGTVTGLTTIVSADAPVNAYDLSGRRVKTPANGLYIVNGKKVLVRCK